MRDRPLLVGSLVVVVAAAGFGMLGVLARFAYDAGLEPFSFVAWRAIFGTLIVVAFVAWQARRGVPLVRIGELPPGQLVALVVGAAAGLALNVSMFFAFDLTSVALVLIGFYTYPAMIAVVATVRGHERLDGARVAALGLASLGMLLVVAGSLDPSGGVRVDPVGIGLAIAAAICQTIFVTASRSYPSVPVEQAMTFLIATTAVACVAFAIVAGQGPSLAVPLLDPSVLGLAVVTGVFAAGIPSVLFLTGVRAIGGTRAGILMLFEPVVGVALAAALLDEQILPVQLLGGLAVLGGALLLQRSGGPEPEQATVRTT